MIPLKKQFAKQTILVVEDEDDLRSLVCETLTNAGYKVIAAANGREALAALKKLENPVDLVLTDVVMPVMGVMDLAKEVQVLMKGKNTKILFQSGYTEDALVRCGVDSKDVYFLEKPYALRILLNTVRDVLGQNTEKLSV